MDYQTLLNKASPFLKQNILALSLGALGMIFFAYGLIGLFVSSKSASEDIVFEANSAKQNSTEARTVAVDIEGAVVKPGLYNLPINSRIQDALIAAGGLSVSADREYVAKNLNLATKLSDGAKIYILSIGQSVGNSGVLNSYSQLGETAGLVNINTGSQSQLEELPGIGPKTADKIIAGRPYQSVDELLSKKIVGSKVFNQIKDKVSVY